MLLKVDDVNMMLDTYRATGSIKCAARTVGISEYRARRIIISAGMRTRYNDEIAEESARGLTVEEIARKHGVSVKAIRAHLPYTRGAYNVEPRSANAQRIAERRARKREEQK